MPEPPFPITQVSGGHHLWVILLAILFAVTLAPRVARVINRWHRAETRRTD